MEWKPIAKKLASRAAKRKLAKSVPVLGGLFSLLFVAQKIEEKGAKRGSIDAALDFTPVVGRAKALYEIFGDDVVPPAR
ncbi:MAG TPA: hypothetical protein RMH99_10655 [Sandaracinaceae bacterium LLY-WYZ-13_1]|nr:hypothetical protein [Sandaracinaceae bacterium LLY-WYZ-13_1]